MRDVPEVREQERAGERHGLRAWVGDAVLAGAASLGLVAAGSLVEGLPAADRPGWWAATLVSWAVGAAAGLLALARRSGRRSDRRDVVGLTALAAGLGAVVLVRAPDGVLAAAVAFLSGMVLTLVLGYRYFERRAARRAGSSSEGVTR